MELGISVFCGCFAEVTHLMEASHNNSGAADGVVIINRYCSLSIHNKNEAALAAVFIKELGDGC